MSWRFLDWGLLAALFACAVVARWSLRGAHFFNDEAISYYISRHFGQVPPNVYNILGDPINGPWSWFFERPAFYVLMSPASWISFEAYRIEFIFLSSTLAPLAYALLVQRGVRRAVATAAAAVVALHPQFVIWGATTVMDSTMTAALAAGLLAVERSRPALAGACFLAAAWMKELAVVAVGFLLVLSLGTMWSRRKSLGSLLPLDRYQTSLVAVLTLGLLPFWIAQEMGFGLPGGGGQGAAAILTDRLVLSTWLAPFLVAGLLFAKSRQAAAFALLLSGFFLVFHVAFDFGIRDWYLVAPTFFGTIAAAMGLDALFDRAGRLSIAKYRSAARTTLVVVSAALCAVLAVEIGLKDSPEKDRWLNPVSHVNEPSLQEALHANANREPEARQALAYLAANPVERLLLVDLHYALIYHPLPDLASEIRTVDTAGILLNATIIQAIATGFDSYADLTFLQVRYDPLNQAVRDVYADCLVHQNPYFQFYDGKPCPGRGPALRDSLERAIHFER